MSFNPYGTRRRSFDFFDLWPWLVGAIVALAIILTPVWAISWSNAHSSVTCTVESKDRTKDSDGNSDQRLYCVEGGVLQVADDMINGQWNSSDLYAKVKVGKTYTFDAVGWRNGFLSLFPNAVSIEK